MWREKWKRFGVAQDCVKNEYYKHCSRYDWLSKIFWKEVYCRQYRDKNYGEDILRQCLLHVAVKQRVHCAQSPTAWAMDFCQGVCRAGRENGWGWRIEETKQGKHSYCANAQKYVKEPVGQFQHFYLIFETASYKSLRPSFHKSKKQA